MRSSVSKNRTIINTLIHIFLVILSIIWLLPIAWLLITSFRGQPTGAFPQFDIKALRASGDILGALKTILLPTEWTLDNYILLFTDQTLFKYPRWFMNTLFVAVMSCIISTIIILLTSYALSRLRFKMRKPFMNIILILGMFPGFMSMIAIYHILKTFGLSQSLWALILVYSGGAAMSYYISKGFFDTIPRDIDEAAMIDGASRSEIFWKVTLPLSKPIVVYTILTTFIAPWCDFVLSSIIMRDYYDGYTMALGLYQMLTRENIDAYFTRFAAGAVIVAIPITLLFIKMQKYYVSGVTGGAVKG